MSVTRTLETTPEGLGKGKLIAKRFELIVDKIIEGASSWNQALIEAELGRTAEAMKIFKGLPKLARVMQTGGKIPLLDAGLEAVFYAAVSNREMALRKLTQSCDENPQMSSLYFLLHFFDKYRSDPEFIGLLEKIGRRF